MKRLLRRFTAVLLRYFPPSNTSHTITGSPFPDSGPNGKHARRLSAAHPLPLPSISLDTSGFDQSVSGLRHSMLLFKVVPPRGVGGWVGKQYLRPPPLPGGRYPSTVLGPVQGGFILPYSCLKILIFLFVSFFLGLPRPRPPPTLGGEGGGEGGTFSGYPRPPLVACRPDGRGLKISPKPFLNECFRARPLTVSNRFLLCPTWFYCVEQVFFALGTLVYPRFKICFMCFG